MGRAYTCSVSNLTVTEPNKLVEAITGSHEDRKTNNDVVKVNIDKQICLFFPSGFEYFFPNIEGLRVAQSGLISLKQPDISPFLLLRNCDMFNNQLKVLDSNVFEKNLNLEYLYFGDNQLSVIGFNILKPLNKLHKAVFQGNQCIGKNADTSSELVKLQKSINQMCGSVKYPEYGNENSTSWKSEEKMSSIGVFWIVFGCIIFILITSGGAYYIKFYRLTGNKDTGSITGVLPLYSTMDVLN